MGFRGGLAAGSLSRPRQRYERSAVFLERSSQRLGLSERVVGSDSTRPAVISINQLILTISLRGPEPPELKVPTSLRIELTSGCSGKIPYLPYLHPQHILAYHRTLIQF